MRTLIATLLASAFITAPAFACGAGKTAEHKMFKTTASLEQPKNDEAMSTFDPAKKPAFEDKAEKIEQPAETKTEPVIE